MPILTQLICNPVHNQASVNQNPLSGRYVCQHDVTLENIASGSAASTWCLYRSRFQINR